MAFKKVFEVKKLPVSKPHKLLVPYFGKNFILNKTTLFCGIVLPSFKNV